MMGKKDAYINFPTYSQDVEKIVVTGRSGASASTGMNVYVGNNAVSTETTGCTGTNTYEIASGYQAAGTQYTLKVTSNHNAQITMIEVFFASAGNGTATSVTINASGITNTNVYTSTAAGSLSATVFAGEDAIEGATVTWTSSKPEVATIGENTGVVTLVAAGKTTITASYAGVEGEYKSSTNTYELTVTNSNPNANDGSAEKPFTVAEAIAFIETLDGATSSDDVYVSGIVSQVDSYNSNYSSITYWISDDGTTANQMEVYSGKGLNGAGFSSVNDLAVGDVVTVKGKVKSYQGTPEFDKNNELVRHVGKPAAPTFSPAAGTYTSPQSVAISAVEGATIYYTIDGSEPTTESTVYAEAIAVNATTTIKAIAVKDGKVSDVATAEFVIDLTPTITVSTAVINAPSAVLDGTIPVTYNNIPSTVPVIINWYTDATGSTITQEAPSWITINFDADKNVLFSIAENTGEARTAYMKLSVYYDPKDVSYYSELITFNQAAPVIPTYATLPFEFDGGKSGIEDTDGLYQDGLGTDYSSSPKLKFDGTGDYLLLQFSERPGTLTFDIKGNGFSGGTFKVQTSEDGISFTDLEAYDNLGNTQNEEFNDLGENVRYIKWIYTEKSSGNVALGNIALAKYTEPVSSITVDPATVNASATDTEGTLALTYQNLAISDMSDFYVQFYDEYNQELTGEGIPSWIEVLVAEQDPSIGEGYVVSYTMDENTTDEARTAYFEILALGNVDYVYSNRVTITQAAYIAPFVPTTYTLATTITSGKHYIITNGEDKAMGSQNSNNRAAADVEINSGVATVSSADVYEFVIQGPDASGNYTIYDETNSGYLYAASNSSNHLKNEATLDKNNNGKWSIVFDGEGVATIKAQGKNSRNWMRYNSSNDIFSCYGEGQNDIYLYEKDGEVAPTETVTITAAKYATYCSENALDFSGTGLTAYIAKMNGTNVEFTPVTKVPAYNGVLLKADAAGDFTVNATSSVDEVTDNVFIGVTKETTINETGIFVLMNGEKGVGFYKTTQPFTLKANSAYLPALGEGARTFIGFDNETTAIEGVAVMHQNGEVYNLQGQRVVAPQKGLYIVNGKKVLVK